MPVINWKALKNVDLKGFRKPSQWFSKSVKSQDLTAAPALNKSLEADMAKAKAHNPEDQVELNSEKPEKELTPTPDGRDSLVKTSAKFEDVLPAVKAEKVFDQLKHDLDHALADYQSYKGFKTYKENVADLPAVKSQQSAAKEAEQAKPKKDDLTHALEDYAAYTQKSSPYAKGAFDLPAKLEPAISKEVEKATTPEPTLAFVEEKPASTHALKIQDQVVIPEPVHVKDTSDTASIANTVSGRASVVSNASTRTTRERSVFKEHIEENKTASDYNIGDDTSSKATGVDAAFEELQPPVKPWVTMHNRNKSQESLFTDGASLHPDHASAEFRDSEAFTKAMGSGRSFRDSGVGTSIASESTTSLGRVSTDFSDMESVKNHVPVEESKRKSFASTFRRHRRSGSSASADTASTNRSSFFTPSLAPSQRTFASVSSKLNTAGQAIRYTASDMKTLAKKQSANFAETASTMKDSIINQTDHFSDKASAVFKRNSQDIEDDGWDFKCAGPEISKPMLMQPEKKAFINRSLDPQSFTSQNQGHLYEKDVNGTIQKISVDKKAVDLENYFF